MTPMERQAAWVDRMLRQTESGEAIDWNHERRLVDLETIAADIHYSADAVERNKAADEELIRNELDADMEVLGGGTTTR